MASTLCFAETLVFEINLWVSRLLRLDFSWIVLPPCGFSLDCIKGFFGFAFQAYHLLLACPHERLNAFKAIVPLHFLS
jgi:hypothetical protein